MLTTNDMSKLLKEKFGNKEITGTWLKDEVRRGNLPCLNIEGGYHFNPEVIVSLLEARARGTDGEAEIVRIMREANVEAIESHIERLDEEIRAYRRLWRSLRMMRRENKNGC